jgi:AraC family transcriptional regulator of adaptative response/methylated-DNA-[protein]-cysteine methyltransferase
MSKNFLTNLDKSKRNKNVKVHEFFNSKNSNENTINFSKITYQFKNSTFGQILIMNSEMGLCGLAFCDHLGKDAVLADMKLRWRQASYKEDTIFSDREFKSILDRTKQVELCLLGSKLQIQVWKALLKIPTGKVISYTTLAKYIGKPKAVRTIATAIGKNPLCWLIPCHRVLRANGELGGYHWGLNVKRKMLTYESQIDKN